jgi:hypothetical protein
MLRVFYCSINNHSRVQGSAQPPAKKTAGQIEIETLKKENIEYRIMNVEGMYSVYFKKTERSETLLHNYAVRYSLICGSLFNPGHRSGQSNHQETVPF